MRRVYSIAFIFFAAVLSPVAGAPDACKTMPPPKAGDPPRPAWDPRLSIDLRQKADKSSVDSGDCTPNLFYERWEDPKNPTRQIKSTTKVPEDGRLERRTSQSGRDKFTCDHILELQLVKDVMERRGGACDEAQKLVAAGDLDGAKAKLAQIRFWTWQHANLYMLEKVTEELKGNSVNKGAGWFKKQNWYDINAIYGYITGDPGSGIDTNVATKIDTEIRNQFPEVTVPDAAHTDGVLAEWTKYQAMITTVYLAAEKTTKEKVCKLAEKERNRKQGGGSAGGGGAGGSTNPGTVRRSYHRRAPTLPARMVRRHHSILPAMSISEGISSSLVVRATRAGRGAARSGPHAPKAPTCPCNNKEQKKVVPRSQAKTKAPPTPRPRKPTQTPPPRAPNPKKQSVKRPATRARRDVGKQRPQQRASPKRKPKAVPKPTRRPKGKPRTRRRRR